MKLGPLEPPRSASHCTECFGAREVLRPPKDFTFMGRLFTSRARSVACPRCSVASAVGVKTNCFTGMKSIAPLTIEGHFRAHALAITITEGGVTGCESVYADEWFLDTVIEKGWCACAGTPGRYDALVIPAREMRRVLEQLRIR